MRLDCKFDANALLNCFLWVFLLFGRFCFVVSCLKCCLRVPIQLNRFRHYEFVSVERWYIREILLLSHIEKYQHIGERSVRDEKSTLTQIDVELHKNNGKVEHRYTQPTFHALAASLHRSKLKIYTELKELNRFFSSSLHLSNTHTKSIWRWDVAVAANVIRVKHTHNFSNHFIIFWVGIFLFFCTIIVT